MAGGGPDEAALRTEWDDLDKVVVDVEITDWPTSTQNPRGRVIEILGYEGDFGVDVEIVIRKFHIPHRFPPEVLDEAEAIEPVISAPELHRRRDYRRLPIVTIDGETARDFDDAVLVGRLKNGNYELQVHIADVTHYVTSDSGLDQEARRRGTSVYFPDRAVPMLPLELSTDICSLRPHLDRLVMSCIMEIDHQGEVIEYEISEGVISALQNTKRRWTVREPCSTRLAHSISSSAWSTLLATAMVPPCARSTSVPLSIASTKASGRFTLQKRCAYSSACMEALSRSGRRTQVCSTPSPVMTVMR